MATRAGTTTNLGVSEPTKKRNSSRSPARTPKPNGTTKGLSSPPTKSYKSDGVGNYDIFSLPGSDWQLLIFITFFGALVRLYKITQPTSVVFDEVQYVQPCA